MAHRATQGLRPTPPILVFVVAAVVLLASLEGCSAFSVMADSPSQTKHRRHPPLFALAADCAALSRYYETPEPSFSAPSSPFSLVTGSPLLERGDRVIETTAVECHDDVEDGQTNCLKDERIDAFRSILAVLPQCVEGYAEMNGTKITLAMVNLLGSLSGYLYVALFAGKKSALRGTAPFLVGSLELLYIALSLGTQLDPVQAFQESVWTRLDGVLAKLHNKVKKKQTLWRKMVTAPLQRLHLLQQHQPEQPSTPKLAGEQGVIDVSFYYTPSQIRPPLSRHNSSPAFLLPAVAA